MLPASQSLSTRSSRNSNGRTRQPQSRSSASVAEGHTRSGHRGHDRRTPGHASTSSVNAASSKPPGKSHSQASSSRPSTPAIPAHGRPASPAVPAVARTRALEPPPRSTTPASSVAVESDIGSSNPDPETPGSPPTIQAAPSVPPGLPPPPTYQLSTQAQALLDDVRARREQVTQPHVSSPFPEFDRTLDSLGGGDFSFKWTMDPKVTPSDPVAGTQEYYGSFDPFAASALNSTSQQRGTQRQFPQLSSPPGLPTPSTSAIQPVQQASYRGSFNPFADMEDESGSISVADSGDGSRQESRFGFARRRTSPSIGDSPSLAAFASSPIASGSPVHMYQQSNIPWEYQTQQQQVQHLPGVGQQQSHLSPQHQHHQGYEFAHPPGVPIPSVNTLLSSPPYRQQHAAFPPNLRFQPFDNVEADRVRAAGHRADSSVHPGGYSFPSSSVPRRMVS